MRFRIKFITFFIFFFLSLLLLSVILSKSSQNPYDNEPKKEKRKFEQPVISKSVLIGYSNADNLTIFSAFQQNGQINVILSSYGYLNRRVYCRYFDKNQQEISAKSTKPVVVFPEFTIKCKDPSEDVHFIAITINDNDTPSNMHHITKNVEKEKKFEFGVCLAPLFGKGPKILMLLEFLEYYKMQGAEKFTIYVFEINEKVERLLEYYKNQKSPEIEVVKLKNDTKCLNRHRCRHEMQLQDCVYRSRLDSKFVATVDLDERIMAINQDLRILDLLKPQKDIGELRFQCQWTLRYSEVPLDTEPISLSHLPMLNWHNTSHVAPQNHTSKSIIRPEMVESMGVHGVMKFEDSTFSPYLVDPTIAVVRHYRLQTGWSFFLKEAESFGDFWDFRIDEKMEKILRRNIGAIISKLFV